MSANPQATKPPLRILLCAPRGFCAGVVRAIDAVERALAKYGAPVYVRHEIVHNKYVVDGLRRKGAVFVEDLDEVPAGDRPVIFSAHGVPQAVTGEAAARGLFAIDATCPLVTKVHREAMIHLKRGRDIVLVGHAGHPEVIGTMGQLPAGAVTLIETAADARAFAPREAAQLAYVTQTTLSLDDTAEIVAILKARFPAIVGPHKEDICYATTNRQEAVKRVAGSGRRHDRGGRAQQLQLAAPARGGRARRLPHRARWSSAPPTSTGPPSAIFRRSRSPPAPRRPRCWSRRSSTPSPPAMP